MVPPGCAVPPQKSLLEWMARTLGPRIPTAICLFKCQFYAKIFSPTIQANFWLLLLNSAPHAAKSVNRQIIFFIIVGICRRWKFLLFWRSMPNTNISFCYFHICAIPKWRIFSIGNVWNSKEMIKNTKGIGHRLIGAVIALGMPFRELPRTSIGSKRAVGERTIWKFARESENDQPAVKWIDLLRDGMQLSPIYAQSRVHVRNPLSTGIPSMRGTLIPRDLGCFVLQQLLIIWEFLVLNCDEFWVNFWCFSIVTNWRE